MLDGQRGLSALSLKVARSTGPVKVLGWDAHNKHPTGTQRVYRLITSLVEITLHDSRYREARHRR